MRERADGLAALGEAVLPEIRSGSSDRALVALASALAALDRYHRWFPIRLAGAHEVELPKLPGWSESRRYLFLPPPPDLGLLTDDLDPLDRDPSFFKHHLWRVLDLHWHLIDLERHGPVRLLDLSELDSVTETLLARGVARDGGLRIGLASPFRDLAYQAWSQPDDAHPDKGVPYRFVALESSPGPARDELSRILDACREQSVDILCFPELTLDDGLLQWLKDRLAFDDEESPALVVAGSFHEQHDGRFSISSASKDEGATRTSRRLTSWCSWTLRLSAESCCRSVSISSATSWPRPSWRRGRISFSFPR